MKITFTYTIILQNLGHKVMKFKLILYNKKSSLLGIVYNVISKSHIQIN